MADNGVTYSHALPNHVNWPTLVLR